MLARWLHKLRHAGWWVYHRAVRPFNVVRIRSLSPDYHDKDDLMLHACFQLLVDFVEVERGLEMWDPHDHASRAVRTALRDLYWWWKDSRPILVGALERQWSMEREDALAGEDQRRLLELVKHREYLWT